MATLEASLHVKKEDVDAVSALELHLESEMPTASDEAIEEKLAGEALSGEATTKMITKDGDHLTHALDEVGAKEWARE